MSDESVAEILVERAYPGLRPSGLCSYIHSSREEAYCSTCFVDLNALIAEHCRLKLEAWEERDKLVKLLTKMVEGEDDICWFDHHGCCQEHGWFGEPGECGIREARELLGLYKPDTM
jgi:hypothetical protein